MKKLIATSLIFVSFFSKADVCRLQKNSFDSAVKINGLPGYFFKVHPSGKYLTYIENGNRLLDLETGAEVSIPGSIDPVWSIDGALYSHPGLANGEEGMSFYHGHDILEKSLSAESTNPRSDFNDKRVEGVYQSIGTRGDTYSVISDQNGASISHYQINKGKITPTGELTSVCNNIADFRSDLPMLSKDGKYLSIYDNSSNSTKIYSLNGNDCELAMDLGFPTGKVSFNADSTQITFHLDQFGDFDGGYFSGISRDKVKNVVVMKLQKTGDKLLPGDWALASKVTSAGDGGYYPDYDAQGNVYFLEDKDNFFQFVKVGQDQLEWFPYESSLMRPGEDCENCGPIRQKSSGEILAELWTKACSHLGVSLTATPVHFSSIEPNACRTLVQDYWSESLNISREVLLNSCPKQIAQAGKELGVWNTTQAATGEALFKSRCLNCHKTAKSYEADLPVTIMSGENERSQEEKGFSVRKKIPPFNDKDLSPADIFEMQNSIVKGSMPMGSEFDVKERDAVLDFLKRKMIDHPKWKESWEPVLLKYTPENLALELDKQLSASPGMDQAGRAAAERMVNCVYGNIDCDKWLVEYEQGVRLQRMSSSETENALMTMKCTVITNVTPQQCYDWYANKAQDSE